jgi:long-subunit fatty acid transport protein
MTRARLAGALALLAATVVGGRADAEALDTFGFGARSAALAGAVAGGAIGYSAVPVNPGGLAFQDDIQGAVGWGYGVPALRLNGADAGVTAAHGTSIGLSIPIHFRSVTASFGVALYMPDQFVARIQLVPSTEPHFQLLDNALQRLVVTPVVSLRPLSWLSLGLGVTAFADAAGHGITFDVGIVGGDKVGKAALDVSLPTRVAPIAGVMVRPHRRLMLGAAYRGEIDLRLSLDILANVDIAGAITGDTLISLRAINFFTPQRVSLGGSIDLGQGVTLFGELDWVNWSAYHALPDLRILVQLGISPPLLQARFPDPPFGDQWIPRLGVELRRSVHPRVGIAARVGYAFERSPVPNQSGLTSFADNDRHIVAAGVGVELERLIAILPKPLSFDVSLQLHELVPRTDEKAAPFVGQGFTSSGYLLHVGAMLEARF